VISLLLVAVGTAIDFAQGENDTELSTLKTGNGHSLFTRYFARLAAFDGHAIITLGLIVLIATPVLRVAVSIVAFAIERDWTFVVITTLVLALLGVSFAVGA
jgi:uncharacterized membrane protein